MAVNQGPPSQADQEQTPMSASFCPNDEGEDQYENTDEEEEDGNEKPEGL